jgi:phosphate:Na+ symporter
MRMVGLVALFLAGLGLFFHGLGGLKNSIQGLASRRVRALLARWSRQPLAAALWGCGFGAMTQSVTAVAFILASLVGGGLITVPRALPVVAGANLGTALLVLVASFDVHLAVLYVLGVAGILLAFDVGGHRLRALLTMLFFTALLFFGLRAMKEAFAPLPGFAWFGGFVRLLQSSVLLAFLAGALLRLLVQSSPAIAVIAIALSHGGLLTDDQVMAMIFGTGLGVGGSVALLSSNLKGVPRQAAIYQGLLGGSASLAAGAALAIERATGWPLLGHFLRGLPGTPQLHLAGAFLAMQLAALAVALATARSAAGWLARLSPATVEQDLSRPEFLSEHALADPETALLLVEREHSRLLARLPRILDTVRMETAGAASVPADVLHRATAAAAAETQSFLHAVADRPMDRETAARLLLLERRQALLRDLNDTGHDFAQAVGKLRAAPALARLANAMAEGLHAVVLTALEATDRRDGDDRTLLLTLTADRGELMEKLRGNTLSTSPDLPHEAKAQLVYATSLFERAVWLLRQWALTLPAAPAGAP